ncbi:MAG: 23S rRNA (adenine(2503)-C(2))-methyltransferase RlmN [Gammaproteobacteria bacterium]|nr:23S rRNA (adenine(2503)-C(2))-methyltransferase RlmN [Gammaproteobacteria bacterium]
MTLSLLGLNREDLQQLFIQWGEKPFRAAQVMKWIYHVGLRDYHMMTDISKVLRQRLADETNMDLPQVVADHPSRDGSRKWLLRLEDGNSIEMVFIPESDRGTLCISSQVGCTLACSFCSTARQGFNRNLTTAEMIGQILLAAHLLGIPKNQGDRVITNVVLMGMGEPLLNFAAVVKAVAIMLDDYAFGISKRRVTISSAGVVPAIEQLKQVTDVSLAISLHATTDLLRDQLVPLNQKYPIAELLRACQFYADAKAGKKQITFEYVMLDGVNDSDADARRLVKLMRTVPSKVNLIPFNPFPESGYQTSPKARVEHFREILMQAGVITVIRKTRGDDIAAACGQLVGEVVDRTRRSHKLLSIMGEAVA